MSVALPRRSDRPVADGALSDGNAADTEQQWRFHLPERHQCRASGVERESDVAAIGGLQLTIALGQSGELSDELDGATGPRTSRHNAVSAATGLRHRQRRTADRLEWPVPTALPEWQLASSRQRHTFAANAQLPAAAAVEWQLSGRKLPAATAVEWQLSGRKLPAATTTTVERQLPGPELPAAAVPGSGLFADGKLCERPMRVRRSKQPAEYGLLSDGTIAQQQRAVSVGLSERTVGFVGRLLLRDFGEQQRPIHLHRHRQSGRSQ